MARRLKIIAAAAAALFAGPAMADPGSMFMFFAQQTGSLAIATAAATVASYATTIGVLALSVYGAANQRRKARAQAARARAAQVAALVDRSTSLLQAIPPWVAVYGRVVSGGYIFANLLSDRTATDENGNSYTRYDSLRHLVIVTASHKISQFHNTIIDGVPLGPLDSNGWAQPTVRVTFTGSITLDHAVDTIVSTRGATQVGQGYTSSTISISGDRKTLTITGGDTTAVVDYTAEGLSFVYETRTVSFSSSTLTVPLPIVEVLGVRSTQTIGEGAYENASVTVSGDGLTLTRTAGPDAVVTYKVKVAKDPIVRVSYHLGEDTQTADAYLRSVLPSEWLTTDRLQGWAYAVVTLNLTERKFQGGPPAITFDMSGREVYDPRTGTRYYNNNSALVINDFLTSPWGYDCAQSEVNTEYLIAAANACDVATTFTVGTHSYTAPRYTSNGVISTDQSREATLEDLSESMAGTTVNGADWMIIAGEWTAPVMDLVDDDLSGQIELVQGDSGIDEMFNGCRGTYIAFGKSTPSDIEPYSNPTFVAEDGEEYWSDLTLPFTDDKPRAKNLARIITERARNAMIIRYPAKLRAWPLRVGERVRVTSNEYQFNLKYFRVTDWQYTSQSPVALVLQEDSPDAYDEADAVLADPTPNTNMPSPALVPTLNNLQALSGNTTYVTGADGTVTPVVKVTWDQALGLGVADGSGRIVVHWKEMGAADWYPIAPVKSDTRSLTFSPSLRVGQRLIIRARVVNSLGYESSPNYVSHLLAAKTTAAEAVTSLSASPVTAGLKISWGSYVLDTTMETEILWGASLGAATVLFRGAATTYTWPQPPLGSTNIYVRHYDRSGNASATTTSLAVNIDAATLVQWLSISGTGKPASYATVGKSLGLPFESWDLQGNSIVTISDGKVGSTALRLLPLPAVYPQQGNYIPIDRSKKYLVRFWARPSASANGSLYFTLRQYINNTGTLGPLNDGRDPYKPNNVTRAAHNATYGGSSQWGEYSFVWQGSDWQTGVQFVQPNFLNNYSGNTGYWEIQDFTFEEVTAVMDAQVAATAAANDAATALSQLTTIANDNILSKGEKPAVILDWNTISSEFSGNLAQATAYGVTTQKDAYAAAVSAAGTFLSSLTPGWSDTSVDTPILGATFRSYFQDVYTTRQTMLLKIAEIAGTKATWTGVSGTAKPSDGATSDALFGVQGALTLQGNTVTKAGVSNWDAGVHSLDGYVGGAYATAVPANTGNFMIGLNADPLASASYTNIDYAMYGNGSSIEIWLSGVQALVSGVSYSPGTDAFWVIYDGASVRFLKNATLIYSTVAPPGLTLYFDSSIYAPSTILKNLRYGPMTPRNTLWRQGTAPTGAGVRDGDTWWDTSNENLEYTREAGAWVPVTVGTAGLSDQAATGVVDFYDAAGLVYSTIT